MKLEDNEVSSKIAGIEYGILSPDLIKKMAAVEVTSSEIYDIDGMPVNGGLADMRMGVIDPGLVCRTCGNGIKECPGHFGYITLAEPVYNIKFLPYIVNTLNSTCEKCNRLLISDKNIEKFISLLNSESIKNEPRSRIKLIKRIISKASNTTICPHCGAKQEKYKLEKPYDIYLGKQKLTPVEVREKLSLISDSDAILLGFDPEYSRPEWMIITLLPVPPVTTRPPITLENGMRSEDDLTHILASIVRTNEKLKENLRSGVPMAFIYQLWDVLQYYVATFISNSVSQLPKARQTSGTKLLVGIEERLKGKDGRFRGTLLGKRVNYSARSVISPDSFIEFDEVGFPLKLAKEITVPERVTSINIDRMRALIKNYNGYPGAAFIITPDGIRKKINETNVEQILQELSEGYIVERHLMDGDYIIFNREPSLHKYSIMGHRVKVLPSLTFTISPAVTTPYNADFDGDEMNVFLTQTLEATAEVEELMNVKNNIVSVRHSFPLIGAKQDYITGCSILTSKDYKVDKYTAQFLLSNIGIYIPIDKDTYTGREIFSMLLPKDLNFEGPSSTYKVTHNEDDYVVIKNGKLISGIIDTETIGVEGGELIRRMYLEYGSDFTADFINKIAKLSILVLLLHGFSASISDYDMKDESLKQKDNLTKELVEKAKKIIESEKDPDEREGQILELAGEYLAKLNKLVSPLYTRNNFVYGMAISKAKGSIFQVTLTSFALGQQRSLGKRIQAGYKNRVLPHFKKNDESLEARGFVFSSYRKGLNPIELFMHAVEGRESIADTKIATPYSGYLERRFIYALADLVTDENRSVRYGNKIIQPIYGEDGIDVSKSDNGDLLI
ncbi:MAG: DNA-directed RNA polymerase subunit A' [Candidatus Parvarchaeota archaeon]|nr:DNA-directed RNA polymerase subunit A' [Candidatus Rehaiarchaeum fermentans]